MSKIPEKYHTLKSLGLVKRIDDATERLEKHALSHKGLNQSLLRLKEILIVDLPQLEAQLQRSKTIAMLLKALLAISACFILGSILIPMSGSFEILKTPLEKTNFIEASMNIIVGLIVSTVSALLWSKKYAQKRVKKLTDQIHELAHRFHMYQLGKHKKQIVPPEDLKPYSEEQYNAQLKVYLSNIQLGILLCAKTVVIIYHFSDDDEITSAARHIEGTCAQMISEMNQHWQNLAH